MAWVAQGDILIDYKEWVLLDARGLSLRVTLTSMTDLLQHHIS